MFSAVLSNLMEMLGLAWRAWPQPSNIPGCLLSRHLCIRQVQRGIPEIFPRNRAFKGHCKVSGPMTEGHQLASMAFSRKLDI